MVTRQVISKKKSLPIEKFRIVFNFEWFKKSKQVAKKFDKFDKKLYEWKKENLERTWTLEKNTLVLAERIKKRSALGKFYKSSVQNIAFLKKKRSFYIE